eukprot:5384231-Pyramimonas_sp.AAC.1
MFILENVMGVDMTSSCSGAAGTPEPTPLEFILRGVRQIGNVEVEFGLQLLPRYTVKTFSASAYDVGLPHVRERFWFVGVLKDEGGMAVLDV